MDTQSTGRLTTHVLDTAQGKPAAGIQIELWALDSDGEDRRLLKTVTTNQQGRTDAPLLADGELVSGSYELVFAVADYFSAQQVRAGEPPFLGLVPIRFAVADADSHYHVPLLVSPWSYTTYRGS